MDKSLMIRALRNYRKEHLKIKKFRGRDIEFKPKQTRFFDMDKEEEKVEYYLWKERFGQGNPVIADVSILFPKITGVYPKEKKEEPYKKFVLPEKVEKAIPKIKERNIRRFNLVDEAKTSRIIFR